MGLTLCIYAAMKIKDKRRQRRFKIRPINRGRQLGGNHNYYQKMKSWDPPQFFKYTRMTVPVFEKLFKIIKPKISRQRRSDGISSEERLVITLQFLSQGMSMQTLAWNFQIGHTTVHKIVHETCVTLWNELHEQYVKSPSTEEEWLGISTGFEKRWHFPQCIGALDGKHISIQAPAHSGSLYFNYKKKLSVVLLAACDSKYRFTLADIGAYGSQSDGGVFRNSVFGQRLDEDTFNVPKASLLEKTSLKMPYFMVADEAFPLKQFIMRPYGGRHLSETQRIFNYRLSRARQVIENTFGIMAARWRILRTTINCKPENVDSIIKAVVVLHNYCQTESATENEEGNIYCPPGFADTDDEENGAWRGWQTPLQSVGRLSSNYARKSLYSIRDSLAEHLTNGTGQVDWQRGRIYRGLHLQNT